MYLKTEKQKAGNKEEKREGDGEMGRGEDTRDWRLRGEAAVGEAGARGGRERRCWLAADIVAAAVGIAGFAAGIGPSVALSIITPSTKEVRIRRSLRDEYNKMQRRVTRM